jgi:hypothetical protein
LQHFIAGHADAEDELLADGHPARFKHLEPETHPIVQRAGVTVAAAVHRR